MNEQQSKHYFLGANTADGFYSLYDSLVSLKDGDFLRVIKGGAGCGKSSFMRMIAASAERAGLAVEYAVCSGDPDSLDGIYIPELKTAYMDGTAPHSADTNLTAADSCYLDLGQFYDCGAIAEYKNELLNYKRENSLQYKKAYSLLSAAGSLRRNWLSTFPRQEDVNSAEKRVGGIIRRELGTRHRAGGKVTKRFLSALTCRGHFDFQDTALAACRRFYLFESKLGLAPFMLKAVAESALNSGFDILLCLDPLTPEMPEAVLIPGISLGFVSSGSVLSGLPSARRIHLDPKGEDAPQKTRRSELLRCEKLTAALINEAVASLGDAKIIHDKLERIYNPNVDFDGVYALCAKHIHDLGLK